MTTPRKAIPPALRNEVWRCYIGNSITGKCFVCGRAEIELCGNVEFGHVIAVANGGENTLENLRPICSSCNRSMGTRNLLEYKRDLEASGVKSAAPTDILSIARDTGTIGATVCATARDPFLFAALQLLTNAQIDALASIIGAPNTREAIAARQFQLPRQIDAHLQDIAREFIARADEKLVCMIFGVPRAGAPAQQVRVYALWCLGLAERS